MSKFFNRKNTAIFILCIFFIMLTLIAFVPVFIQGKGAIISEFDNGTKLSGDGKSRVSGGWAGFTERNEEVEIVVTNNHILQPTLSIIADETVLIVNLDRDSVVDFDVIDYQLVTTNDLSFEQLVNLAQRYDLSKENPDPENITIFEPIELPEPTEADIRYDLCIEKIGSGEITTQEELLECNDLNNPID
jgi:hypothetical protein